jgi:hypothetical protein
MKEARSVGVTVRLVEEHSLRRYQRVTFKKSQGRLAELWDKYEAKTIKTSGDANLKCKNELLYWGIKIVKEALATILIKKIICFGSW